MFAPIAQLGEVLKSRPAVEVLQVALASHDEITGGEAESLAQMPAFFRVPRNRFRNPVEMTSVISVGGIHGFHGNPSGEVRRRRNVQLGTKGTSGIVDVT